MDIHIRGILTGLIPPLLMSEYQIPCHLSDSLLGRRNSQPGATDQTLWLFCSKPFSERELHATIQMALERHRHEKRLFTSETRLPLALEAAQMGEWSWLPVIVIVPHRCYLQLADVMFGYPEHAFCGNQDRFMTWCTRMIKVESVPR